MTFVNSRVICDGCGYDGYHNEFQESIVDPVNGPWVSASVNVRGECLLLTFCPECAKKPMTIPDAAEIVRRVRMMLR